VLQRLDLPPARCLALEDSSAGVLAAVAAGLPVVVTRSRFTGSERIEGALADLSGLGSDDRPASGWHAGRRWSGAVRWSTLLEWHREDAAGPTPSLA
jgi:hypothetical protein